MTGCDACVGVWIFLYLFIRASLLDSVHWVIFRLNSLMLLIVLHLRDGSLIIRGIDRLILFRVRVAHALLGLSSLGGGSLRLGLLRLVKLTEVEERYVNLVSRWHWTLSVVNHSLSSFLRISRAIINSATLNGRRIIMHLPHLVHALVLPRCTAIIAWRGRPVFLTVTHLVDVALVTTFTSFNWRW